jgi:hypothetical protein
MGPVEYALGALGVQLALGALGVQLEAGQQRLSPGVCPFMCPLSRVPSLPTLPNSTKEKPSCEHAALASDAARSAVHRTRRSFQVISARRRSITALQYHCGDRRGPVPFPCELHPGDDSGGLR